VLSLFRRRRIHAGPLAPTLSSAFDDIRFEGLTDIRFEGLSEYLEIFAILNAEQYPDATNKRCPRRWAIVERSAAQ